jgi:hypothetical protein
MSTNQLHTHAKLRPVNAWSGLAKKWSDKLKGTLQRDFLTPVFFTKRLILVSIDIPESDFKIFQIFVESFELKS